MATQGINPSDFNDMKELFSELLKEDFNGAVSSVNETVKKETQNVLQSTDNQITALSSSLSVFRSKFENGDFSGVPSELAECKDMIEEIQKNIENIGGNSYEAAIEQKLAEILELLNGLKETGKNNTKPLSKGENKDTAALNKKIDGICNALASLANEHVEFKKQTEKLNSQNEQIRKILTEILGSLSSANINNSEGQIISEEDHSVVVSEAEVLTEPSANKMLFPKMFLPVIALTIVNTILLIIAIILII